MAAPLPFSESELRLLQVLLKRKVRFMVVGLSAATLTTGDQARINDSSNRTLTTMNT